MTTALLIFYLLVNKYNKNSTLDYQIHVRYNSKILQLLSHQICFCLSTNYYTLDNFQSIIFQFLYLQFYWIKPVKRRRKMIGYILET